jgi:hypothetical protein
MKIKIPGRLLCAVLLNIVVNVMGQIALGYLLVTGIRPGFVGAIHTYNIGIAICVSIFLYISCAMALLGKPRGRQMLLAAALITYGINFLQTAHVLYINYENFNHQQHAQFYFSISTIMVELLINIWALDSAKTRQFFFMKAKQRMSVEAT